MCERLHSPSHSADAPAPHMCTHIRMYSSYVVHPPHPHPVSSWQSLYTYTACTHHTHVRSHTQLRSAARAEPPTRTYRLAWRYIAVRLRRRRRYTDDYTENANGAARLRHRQANGKREISSLPHAMLIGRSVVSK